MAQEDISKEDIAAQEEAEATEEKKTDAAEASGGDTAGDKKKDRKKDKEKDKEKEKLKAEAEKNKEYIAELEDRTRRQMAEFDNFRKRTEKEKAQMFDMGAKTVLEKILPIVDNFERGFTTVQEDDKEDAFVKGMDMVYKQLLKQLEDAGVKPIEAVGCEFDPTYHDAIAQVDGAEGQKSGTVSQEYQKGYMYKDMVLRHSVVAVVR